MVANLDCVLIDRDHLLVGLPCFHCGFRLNGGLVARKHHLVVLVTQPLDAFEDRLGFEAREPVAMSSPVLVLVNLPISRLLILAYLKLLTFPGRVAAVFDGCRVELFFDDLTREQ